MIRQVLQAFAEYERKVIAARTRAAMLRHQAAAGALNDARLDVRLEAAAAEAPARPVPTMMMVCFRRLAGFTSLFSKRALSHFAATGPDGIFESSVMPRLRSGAPRWQWR